MKPTYMPIELVIPKGWRQLGDDELLRPGDRWSDLQHGCWHHVTRDNAKYTPTYADVYMAAIRRDDG